MNNPTTSVLGTISAMLAATIVTWLASKNIIPTAEVSEATAVIGSALVGFIGLVIVYIKAKMATQTSQIAAVNAIDGVKVVAQTAPAPVVTAVPK